MKDWPNGWTAKDSLEDSGRGPHRRDRSGFRRLAAVAPRWLSDLLKEANTSVVNGLGWYYSLIVAGFVGFALLVAFGPYGNITLGPDDEPPSYSW